MNVKLTALAVLAVAATSSLSTIAAAQPAFPPPPPEIGEPPPPPGPPARFVLEPGHWRWNGVRYVWIPRHWIGARIGYGRFIPGHWRGGIWIEPHWVR